MWTPVPPSRVCCCPSCLGLNMERKTGLVSCVPSPMWDDRRSKQILVLMAELPFATSISSESPMSSHQQGTAMLHSLVSMNAELGWIKGWTKWCTPCSRVKLQPSWYCSLGSFTCSIDRPARVIAIGPLKLGRIPHQHEDVARIKSVENKENGQSSRAHGQSSLVGISIENILRVSAGG